MATRSRTPDSERFSLSRLLKGTALSILGVTGNAQANYADIVAGSDGQVLRRSGTALGFGAVSLATAAAVTGVLPTANGGTSVDIASAALPLGSGQVTFPATQNPSAGANTLDDYEEGTWTPTVTGTTSGAATYTSQSGLYTKIGQLVVASFNVVTAGAGTLAGNVQISALPFTVNNLFASSAVGSVFWGTLAAGTYMTMIVIPTSNSTDARLFGATAATATLSAVPVSIIGAATNIAGTIMYRASA